jgi:hypothetical protein
MTEHGNTRGSGLIIARKKGPSNGSSIPKNVEQARRAYRLLDIQGFTAFGAQREVNSAS